jgi:1-acyl-sn-glycerol-3-phosphate acyltransferase
VSDQVLDKPKTKSNTWLYNIGKFFVWLFVHLRFGLKVIGKENVPKKGGVLVVSNHRSSFDPPVIGLAFPRVMNFMAKKELFEHVFLKWLFKQLQAFPVDRTGNASGAIKESIRRLRGGSAVLIFAQGTRNEGDAKALDGAAFIAQRAKVAVLPTAIWQEGRRFVVSFGEPMFAEGSSREETHVLTEKIMEEVNLRLPLDFRHQTMFKEKY